MASRPDDWMVEVELVEDDEPISVAARAGRTRSRNAASRRPGGRRRWWVLGAVLAVGVVGGMANVLGVGGGVGDPVAPSGSVGSVDHPLRELWRTSAGDLLGTSDGAVILATERFGERRVVALDETTGEQRWVLPLGGAGGVDLCSAVVTEVPPALWCWRDERSVVDPGTGQEEIRSGAMLEVSLTSGQVVAESETGRPSAGLVGFAGQLIRGDRDGDTMTLRSLEPVTMTQNWSVVLDLEPRNYFGLAEPSLELASGFLLLRGPGTAVLDPIDGRVIGMFEAPLGPRVAGLGGVPLEATGQGFAVWDEVVGEVWTTRGTWYDADGARLASFDGELAEPAVSDGSTPQVLLVRWREHLLGIDPAGGGELWSLPFADGAVLLRQAGTVLIAEGEEVTALDALTGLPRWSAHVAGLRPDAGAVTDGRAVLVMAVQGNRWMLEAHSVDAGERLWFAEAPGAPDINEASSGGEAPRLEVIGEQPVVRAERTLTWLG